MHNPPVPSQTEYGQAGTCNREMALRLKYKNTTHHHRCRQSQQNRSPRLRLKTEVEYNETLNWEHLHPYNQKQSARQKQMTKCKIKCFVIAVCWWHHLDSSFSSLICTCCLTSDKAASSCRLRA